MERAGEGKTELRRTNTKESDCRAVAIDSGRVLHAPGKNYPGKETNLVPPVSNEDQQPTATPTVDDSDPVSPATTGDKPSHNIQSVNGPNTNSGETNMICSSTNCTYEERSTPQQATCEFSPQLPRNISRFDELCQYGSAVICAQELGSGDDVILTPTPATTLCVALNRLMQDSGYILKEV